VQYQGNVNRKKLKTPTKRITTRKAAIITVIMKVAEVMKLLALATTLSNFSGTFLDLNSKVVKVGIVLMTNG